MKRMEVGVFEANYLAILDEVRAKRETVVTTKRRRNGRLLWFFRWQTADNGRRWRSGRKSGDI